MALLAFYFDALRLWRLQNWLAKLSSLERAEEGQILPEPPAGGVLGEIADRMHRLLRWRLRAQRESQMRLQEMLDMQRERRDPRPAFMIFLQRLLRLPLLRLRRCG